MNSPNGQFPRIRARKEMQEPIRVLLIEDNPDDARLAKEALVEGNLTFNLSHSERLSDAVDLLEKQRFNVVLLDLGLPDSQGLATLLRLHRQHPHLPIVVMTATDIEKLGLLAVREGAQDYLVKSRMQGDLLGRAIRYAMERNELTKNLLARTALASLTAEVGAAFMSGHDQRPILQRCSESILKHLGVCFAGIWVVGPEGDALVLEGHAGTHPHQCEIPHRVDIHHTKLGQIVTQKKPYLSSDTVLAELDFISSEGEASFAGYPLLLGGSSMGVVVMLSRRPISSLAQQTMASLTNHIALGLGRIRAEQARRHEEAKWKAMSDSNLLGVSTWSVDGRILEANDAFLRQTGYSRDDLLAGKLRWDEITPSEYRHLDEKCIAEVQQMGRCNAYEKEYIRKDGSRMPILTGSAALPGEPDKGLALFLDRTEMKRSEEANYFLQAVVERSDHAIIGSTLNGTILAWNPGAERLYGYAHTEIIGKHISLLLPPEREDELRVAMETVRRGDPVLSIETLRRRKDGQLIDVSVSMSPIRNKSGQVIGVSKIAHDIREKKRLEEQFRQSQKMEAVGQLAAGVAHDFNNLLTVINGFSEVVLEDPLLSVPTRERVTEISKAGKRAESLTRQLLAFSHKSLLEPRILNINEVVSNSIKMLQRIVGENIVITTLLASRLENVRADPNQIEHAIVNLVVNARDAMPNGGRLIIETATLTLDEAYAERHPTVTPGRYVMLAISDTGTGMTAEVAARIFEPFFTTKGIGRGTGLGLPAVSGIVQESGGCMSVESAPDQGTTIKLFLPPTVEQVPVSKSAGLANTARGSETVLLVEDDDPVRMIAAVALKKQGYTVLEARHGDEAIGIWEQHRDAIRLLVTDVAMPGMNGRELAEHLRAQNSSIRVLYLSGYNEDAVVLHGTREGTAFLQKPFTSSVLNAKVREVLDEE